MTPGGETPRSGDPARAAPPRPDSSGTARTGVAVTGLGVVSPLGLGVEEFWSSLVEGRRALGPHPPSPRGITVPSRAGRLGEVADRARELVGARRLRRVSPLSIYAVAAAHLALENANGSSVAESSGGVPTPTDADSTAVVLGTSFGSSNYHFEYYEKLYRGGLRDASPLLFAESVMNAASGHVSLHFGLRGPSLALVGGEEVGLAAIADSMDRLVLGEVSAALAGGGEESCDFVQAALFARGFVSDRGDESCALEEKSTFFSEGAGFLLLEREDETRARGRRVLARLLGRGIARGTSGRGTEREETVAAAMREALHDAAVAPEEIGLVVVSGSGDTDASTAEHSAVDQVLGDGPAPIVLAPKALLGEGFAYTSALQAVIAVELLRRQRIPRALSVDLSGSSAAEEAAESARSVVSTDLRYALIVASNRCGGAVAVVFGAGDD